MAYPKKKSLISPQIAARQAREDSVGSQYTDTFTQATNQANSRDAFTGKKNPISGQFQSKATRNSQAYIARQVRHNSASQNPENGGKVVSRRQRYGAIRAAFGMSAG